MYSIDSFTTVSGNCATSRVHVPIACDVPGHVAVRSDTFVTASVRLRGARTHTFNATPNALGDVGAALCDTLTVNSHLLLTGHYTLTLKAPACFPLAVPAQVYAAATAAALTTVAEYTSDQQHTIIAAVTDAGGLLEHRDGLLAPIASPRPRTRLRLLLFHTPTYKLPQPAQRMPEVPEASVTDTTADLLTWLRSTRHQDGPGTDIASTLFTEAAIEHAIVSGRADGFVVAAPYDVNELGQLRTVSARIMNVLGRDTWRVHILGSAPSSRTYETLAAA